MQNVGTSKTFARHLHLFASKDIPKNQSFKPFNTCIEKLEKNLRKSTENLCIMKK